MLSIYDVVQFLAFTSSAFLSDWLIAPILLGGMLI